MKYTRYLIFFFTVLFFTKIAWARIPFEVCSWKNKEMTENMVHGDQDFSIEASCPSLDCWKQKLNSSSDDQDLAQTISDAISIPPECFFASAVHSVAKPSGKITDENSTIKGTPNYYYCDNAKSAKTQQLSVTNPSGEKQTIDPPAPCLNEEYIMMTHRAFHTMANCFDFTYKEKKYLFKLFNHESHFILNNKSSTGARCYGQITQITAEEIGKRIYLSSNTNTSWKSEIYKNAVDKCPDLPANVHIPDAIRPEGQGQRSDSSFDQYKPIARKLDCQLSQHAPTCFFYAMYNVKMNMKALENTLSKNSLNIEGSIPQHLEVGDIVSQLKTDFLLPIHLDEMLIVEGKFTEADGSERQYSWVMKSDRELYHALYDRNRNHREKRSYNINDLKIRKVKIYDINQDDKWQLIYQAYNGGTSVITDKMTAFIEHGKSLTANGAFCNRTDQNGQEVNATNTACLRRKAMLEQNEYEPIRFEQIKFQNEARLSGQTRSFPSQIEKDMDYLNDEGDSKLPKPLTSHLRRLHNINNGESSDMNNEIENFVQTVKNRCN